MALEQRQSVGKGPGADKTSFSLQRAIDISFERVTNTPTSAPTSATTNLPPPATIESQPGNGQTEEPPPSYDSLFGEIKAAKVQSSGMLDFIGKFFGIIFASVGFLVCLGLLLAIPITSITIGVKYKDDCPVQKYIPIYLIVAGSFGIFRNLLGMFHQGRKTHRKRRGEEVEDDRSTGRKSSEGIIDCFLFAWFICGNVWIYHNYKPNFSDPNNPKYCHKTLYLFAFWLTTATYIAVGFACCCGCCMFALAATLS